MYQSSGPVAWRNEIETSDAGRKMERRAGGRGGLGKIKGTGVDQPGLASELRNGLRASARMRHRW